MRCVFLSLFLMVLLSTVPASAGFVRIDEPDETAQFVGAAFAAAAILFLLVIRRKK